MTSIQDFDKFPLRTWVPAMPLVSKPRPEIPYPTRVSRPVRLAFTWPNWNRGQDLSGYIALGRFNGEQLDRGRVWVQRG
jgi:hypothetical protein